MPNDLNAVDLARLVVKQVERVLTHMKRVHARMERLLAKHVWHIEGGMRLAEWVLHRDALRFDRPCRQKSRDTLARQAMHASRSPDVSARSTMCGRVHMHSGCAYRL